MDLDGNEMYDPMIDGPQYAYDSETLTDPYGSHGDECCMKAAEEEDIETAVAVCHTCDIDDDIDEFFIYEFHECTRRFDKATICLLSSGIIATGIENVDFQYFLEEKLEPEACCEAKM